MKTLKFRPHLVSQVLDGSKNITWRLFDDKDLQVGDKLEFLNKETGEKFAEADITDVREKELGLIIDEDLVGHEKFSSPEEMIETYRKYYGDKVNENTIVKMISFKLI